MKKEKKTSALQKATLSFFIGAFLLTPLFVFGEERVEDAPELGPNFQLVPCGTSEELKKQVNAARTESPNVTGPARKLQNFGCDWYDLLELVRRLIDFLIALSGVLAVFAFAYAGFLYTTAFGEMGKIEQAHGIISKALTGVIIILCAWLLVATILKTLCSVGGGAENCQKFSLLNLGSVEIFNMNNTNSQ